MYRNEVLLAGKVLGDATQASERAPWKFTLTQGGGRKPDSDERWPTSYFQIIAWPNKYEGDASVIKSRDFVEVTGKLRQRTYVNSQNNTRSIVEIIAETVLVKAKEQKQEKPATTDPTSSLQITDADI